jgi:hypothetical protein
VADKIENPGAAAADADTSEAELLQILSGGNASAKPSARGSKHQAKVDDDESDDIEADGDDEAGDNDVGDESAATGADLDGDLADDDAGEKTDDDGEADNAAGKADPDAALDDEDKGVRAKFTPEQQERFDKAVSKKTRRILELKSELADEQRERERIAAELEEARKSGPPASAPTADNPLADIEDEPKLDAKLADARKLRRFALANPDGAFIDKKTGEVVEVEDPESAPDGLVRFSKKRIGEILAETEETLQEHGPKHRQFLQQRAAAEADAVRTFPWLKNKSSQGYVAVEATLRQAPQLRSIPGIKGLLADAFVGRAMRLGAQQQQQQGAAKGGKLGTESSRKAPPSPGGGARPPRIDGKRKAAGGALETVATTGDDPDNAGLRALLRS